MRNLLKSDFYKLFRMKSFYVCCIVAAVISVVSMSLNAAVNSMTESFGDIDVSVQTTSFENILYNLISPDGDWFILAIIGVSLFVTIEYNSGTLKNIAARGFKRENIFFSKLIVCIVETFIITLCFALACVISGALMLGVPAGGFNDDFWKVFLTMCGVDILILIGYTCFIVMVAYLVRTNGGTIALSLCAHYLIPTVLVMFNATQLVSPESTSSDLEKLISYSTNPYGNVAYCWIGTLGGTVGESYHNGTIYIPILIAIAYIVVTSFLGMLTFKKRDIK